MPGTPITARDHLMGLAKGTTWGTAVACGAGDGISYKSESISQKTDEHLDEGNGIPFNSEAFLGNIVCNGGIDAIYRFQSFETAMALLMGTAGIPSKYDPALAAYIHWLAMKSTIEGLFCTLAVPKKSDKVMEIPSYKIHTMKISGRYNDLIGISFTGIGNKIEMESAVNTTTTFADVTLSGSSAYNRAAWNSAKGTILMNAKAGAALTGTDRIYPSEFDFTISRPMQTDFLDNVATTTAEPLENGRPDVTLTLKFPRYNDAVHALWADTTAYTAKKMLITFLGNLADTGVNYNISIYTPNVYLKNPAHPISGGGSIPFSVELRCLGTDVANTGMKIADLGRDILNPCEIKIVNLLSTNPLA